MPERIVVITGATGGLGPSVVERFRDAGEQVVTVARKDADFTADLTDSAACRGAVQSILEHRGRIDVLVHVMGGFAAEGDLESTTQETWRRMIDMNLMSAVYVFSAVVPQMKKTRYGRIVAVGSRSGAVPAGGVSAYAVSKSALHMLVQCAAEESRENNVTVNAVLPGSIRTSANAEWATREQMSRFVDPASIADLIFFLASDSAAEVTGALVPVYGRS